MKASKSRAGLFVSLLAWFTIPLHAHQGLMVRGSNFEGVIATPLMMRDFDNSPPSIFNKGVWIPSENLVRKAELRLPTALAQIAPEPKVIRRFYVPQYYTPKGATPVASPGHQRVEDNIADSLEDNFLYEVEPLLSNYKRQYLGVTYKGKKYLLISFIDGFYITGDAELKEEWRRRWIAVLDGGDAFWNVLYDPATEKFSEWECNGTG